MRSHIAFRSRFSRKQKVVGDSRLCTFIAETAVEWRRSGAGKLVVDHDAIAVVAACSHVVCQPVEGRAVSVVKRKKGKWRNGASDMDENACAVIEV